MLVLSRKVGESIVIGEGASAITVTVNKIRNGSVSLGVDAPKTTRIVRKEIEHQPASPNSANRRAIAAAEANQVDDTQVAVG